MSTHSLSIAGCVVVTFVLCVWLKVAYVRLCTQARIDGVEGVEGEEGVEGVLCIMLRCVCQWIEPKGGKKERRIGGAGGRLDPVWVFMFFFS